MFLIIFIRVPLEDEDSHRETHEVSLPSGTPDDPQDSDHPINDGLIEDFFRRMSDPRKRREMSLRAMRLMAEAAQREVEYFEMIGEEDYE